LRRQAKPPTNSRACDRQQRPLLGAAPASVTNAVTHGYSRPHRPQVASRRSGAPSNASSTRVNASRPVCEPRWRGPRSDRYRGSGSSRAIGTASTATGFDRSSGRRAHLHGRCDRQAPLVPTSVRPAAFATDITRPA
jgi:hypothetical protein